MYIVDGSFFSLFLFGVLLCELHLLAKDGNLPPFFSRFKPFKNVIFYGFLVASVWLSGVPSHTRDIKDLELSPGWYYLSFLAPQAVFDYKWFYLFWAAVFLVSAVPQIGWLKSFFETRFNQYLGRISFALYLIHGPILWTLGDRVYVAVGWYREVHITLLPGWVNLFPLSQFGPLGFEFSFLAAHLIILPATLWAAELITKLDEQSVRFTQWAYASSLESSE
jgi:peptidoglycan/LPS O-acetylase OafA/YrhL